jgi:hypothetical protein
MVGIDQSLRLNLAVDSSIGRGRIRRRLGLTNRHLKATDYVGQASRRYRRNGGHPPRTSFIGRAPGFPSATASRQF